VVESRAVLCCLAFFIHSRHRLFVIKSINL
jgi:hypothetical protein